MYLITQPTFSNCVDKGDSGFYITPIPFTQQGSMLTEYIFFVWNSYSVNDNIQYIESMLDSLMYLIYTRCVPDPWIRWVKWGNLLSRILGDAEEHSLYKFFWYVVYIVF